MRPLSSQLPGPRQRSRHFQRVAFELIHELVEFARFLGGERALVALGEQFRHALALFRFHSESTTNLPRRRSGFVRRWHGEPEKYRRLEEVTDYATWSRR